MIDLETSPSVRCGVRQRVLHVSDQHGEDEAAERLSGRQCSPGYRLPEDQPGRGCPGGCEPSLSGKVYSTLFEGRECDAGLLGLWTPNTSHHLETGGQRKHSQGPGKVSHRAAEYLMSN